MTERLPNGSDGWVAPEEPNYIDPAMRVFLIDEARKQGNIQVWFDENGVFHIKAMGHPGVTWDVPRIGFDHQGMPV